jgi:hypothetical protein
LGDFLALSIGSEGFRVPSIYQPGKASARSESPRFSAFFACFLEILEPTPAMYVYILGLAKPEILFVEFMAEAMSGHLDTGN